MNGKLGHDGHLIDTLCKIFMSNEYNRQRKIIKNGKIKTRMTLD